jgi:hypothetical protein
MILKKEGTNENDNNAHEPGGEKPRHDDGGVAQVEPFKGGSYAAIAAPSVRQTLRCD